MITQQVHFRCLTCEDKNKSLLGWKDFEVLQKSFDSFSDAWGHLVEHASHEMIAEVEIPESE